MCYITASGYNRMQQITDTLNGMTPALTALWLGLNRGYTRGETA